MKKKEGTPIVLDFATLNTSSNYFRLWPPSGGTGQVKFGDIAIREIQNDSLFLVLVSNGFLGRALPPVFY